MNARKRCWTPVLVATMLVVTGGAVAQAGTDPLICLPPSQFDPPDVAPIPVELPGTGLDQAIYEGATPPNYDPAKPTILFVQGLHGAAVDWWDATEYHGTNDMLNTAYTAGYKTFFVDLWDADGPAATSLKNGRLLNDQIAYIVDYWGIDSLNIVAHSKGGLDSNTAVIVGAHHYVQNIITLSSPHWGSPLVDLAQSSWTDWLADILGYNDAGTKFLQTANMAWFRSVVDPKPQNDNTHYYTFGGTSWGPLFSALAFGGAYLETACGNNDGLVCVEDGKHPHARTADGIIDGQHRLVWDAQDVDFQLDHDSIRTGNHFMDFFWWWEPDDCYITIFGSIEPYAGVFWDQGISEDSPPAGLSPRVGAPVILPGRSILRGGPVAAGQTTRASFPLEAGVTGMTARILAGDATVGWSLIGPDGHRTPGSTATSSDQSIFRGAWVSGATIDAPAPGEWTVEFDSQNDSAYLLWIELDGGDAVELSLPSGRLYRPGERVKMITTDTQSPFKRLDELQLTIEMRDTTPRSAPPVEDPEVVRWTGIGSDGFDAPMAAGVYNLSIVMTVQLGNGQQMERNFTTSIAVITEQGTAELFGGL